MTKEELISAQQSLGFNVTEMAAALNVPYRTYYKWASGERAAPAIAESAIRMLLIIHANGLIGELKSSAGTEN